MNSSPVKSLESKERRLARTDARVWAQGWLTCASGSPPRARRAQERQLKCIRPIIHEIIAEQVHGRIILRSYIGVLVCSLSGAPCSWRATSASVLQSFGSERSVALVDRSVPPAAAADLCSIRRVHAHASSRLQDPAGFVSTQIAVCLRYASLVWRRYGATGQCAHGVGSEWGTWGGSEWETGRCVRERWRVHGNSSLGATRSRSHNMQHATATRAGTRARTLVRWVRSGPSSPTTPAQCASAFRS